MRQSQLRGAGSIAFTTIVFLLYAGIGLAQPSETPRQQPRNLILFIGDGMGPSQLTLLRLIDTTQVLDNFPVGGFSLPLTRGALITESAASGTALSTGVATHRGMVGMTPDGAAVENLLERARALGKSTGIVSTSSVTHATPASFVAHVASRGEQYLIAEQIAGSGTDIVMGGGQKYFLDEQRGGGRSDVDLCATMEAAGYEIALVDAEDCELQLPSNESDRRLLLLAAEDGLPPAHSRSLTLARMTALALARLARNPHGFVLMVEGSQIDWACHDNDFETLQAELLDFSTALNEGVAFAQDDGQTTIVVTADHETGGLALLGEEEDASDIEAVWTSTGHTAAMVPVLAMGPGSASFGGIHRNTDIGRLLHELLSGGIPSEQQR
ncbi:MAG: alkaline phosphatase [Ignavibacteria bacterium]|nr:MAG: alkaline phosphatase [Ignavibacteria bacterium]